MYVYTMEFIHVIPNTSVSSAKSSHRGCEFLWRHIFYQIFRVLIRSPEAGHRRSVPKGSPVAASLRRECRKESTVLLRFLRSLFEFRLGHLLENNKIECALCVAWPARLARGHEKRGAIEIPISLRIGSKGG